MSLAEELDEEQQREFIHDVKEIIGNDDIGGYTITVKGWCWIDFEGPEGAVESAIESIVADERFDEYDLKSQEFPSSRELENVWYGFDEASAAESLDF
jgi:hypothetical protein